MTHSRPATRPMPQMIPAEAMRSSYMSHAASCENSRNGEPGSSSERMRSRGRSLPRPLWRSRATSPPPCSIIATLARRSSTSACIAWRFFAKTSLLRSMIDSIAGMASGGGGTRMSRHELVGVDPAPVRLDAPQPVTQVAEARPVDTDLLGPAKVAAQGEIGDGQAVADDVAAPCEMRVENAPRAFRALAKLGDHRGIGVLGQRAHEAQRRRVAGTFVVVPQQPPQHLA